MKRLAAPILVCIIACILFIYSSNHPKEVLVINKNYHEGYSFETLNGAQVVIYPRYEITVVNAFRIRVIHLNKSEWVDITEWQKYNTKYDLGMYY